MSVCSGHSIGWGIPIGGVVFGCQERGGVVMSAVESNEQHKGVSVLSRSGTCFVENSDM